MQDTYNFPSHIGFRVEIVDTPEDDEIMEKYMPDMWANEQKKKLNENVFAKAFAEVENLRYYNGVFFTRKGRVSEEYLLREIWESIAPVGISQDVARTCKKLLEAVKMASTVKELHIDPWLIPFSNGDFYVKKKLFRMGEYSPTAYRLKAPLLLDFQDTPNFRTWRGNLFTKEDEKTLQEYLGYTLLPTTKGQKALFLVGEGGSGKSGIGIILESIFGTSMVSTFNSQEFMKDKFKAAELENKLVLYDDDLDNTALEGTGMYKKLITNSLVMTADRKYGQPFTFTPFARLIACCNEMLTSAYDQTDGFYRRLLPLKTKPKRKDFNPDPNFYDLLKAEAPGITQWAVAGLYRLIDNDFVIYESERSKSYLISKQNMNNPMPLFTQSAFDYADDLDVSSAEIGDLWKVWCRQNAVAFKSAKEIQSYFNDNAESMNILPSNHIVRGEKEVRGYKGIGVKKEWKSAGQITLK